MVTREELKNILLNMGISKDLLEMPSVFERVYKMVGNKEAVNLDDMIKIDENGDFSLDGYNFRMRPDKEAIIEFKEQNNQKATIRINKYGMDMRYYRQSDPTAATLGMPDDEEIVRVPEHNLIRDVGMHFTETSYKYINKETNDLGNYDITDNPDVLLEEYNRIRQKNKAFLTRNYPLTEGWFQEDEKADYGVEQESKQETDESEDALREATEKIKQLEADNKELREENKRLCEEMNNAQKMLRTTLDFCDKVRLSVFGHIFFRKELGKLPTSYGDDTREQ